MNSNEVLTNLALEHLFLSKGKYEVIQPNDFVNQSQSTNDVYPTALCLETYYNLDDYVYSFQGLTQVWLNFLLEPLGSLIMSAKVNSVASGMVNQIELTLTVVLLLKS